MASGPIMVTTNFMAAMVPGIQGWIGMGIKLKPATWVELYSDQRKMPYEIVREVGLVGMDMPRRVSELGSNTYTSMRQQWQRSYQAQKYRLCFAVSKDVMRGIIYPEVVKARSIEAGDKFTLMHEITGWDIFNNATNTAYAMYDLLPLASTAHLLANGETFSNKYEAHANISESVLENMLNRIETDFKDDTGNLKRISPVRIIAHTNLRQEAYRIQNATLRVNTNYNDPNAIAGMGLLPKDPIITPYITDPSCFAILTDAPNGFVHRQQWALETNTWIDNETGAMKTSMEEKFTNDVGDFRCLFYMPGA